METLIKQIDSISELPHPHSLIAIKDTFEEKPNRFLLYYENAWNCDFFPNFKTLSDTREDSAAVLERISGMLQIDSKYVQVEYKGEEEHFKYSPRDNITKRYIHRLYYAKIESFPVKYRRSNFSISGTKFRWMSIADMKKDKNIQERNQEVVDFIERTVP